MRNHTRSRNRGRRMIAPGGAWTPGAIPFLKLWHTYTAPYLFSDTGGTTPATTTVANVTDRGPLHSPLLQATGANQPTKTTAGGRQGVLFNGTSQYLATAAFTTINEPYTVAFRFAAGASQVKDVWSDQTLNNSFGRQSGVNLACYDGGGQILDFSNATSLTYPGLPVDGVTPAVLIWVFNGSASRGRVTIPSLGFDGTVAFTRGSTTTTLSQLFAANRDNADLPWGGVLFESVVYAADSNASATALVNYWNRGKS